MTLFRQSLRFFSHSSKRYVRTKPNIDTILRANLRNTSATLSAVKFLVKNNPQTKNESIKNLQLIRGCIVDNLLSNKFTLDQNLLETYNIIYNTLENLSEVESIVFSKWDNFICNKKVLIKLPYYTKTTTNLDPENVAAIYLQLSIPPSEFLSFGLAHYSQISKFLSEQMDLIKIYANNGLNKKESIEFACNIKLFPQTPEYNPIKIAISKKDQTALEIFKLKQNCIIRTTDKNNFISK